MTTITHPPSEAEKITREESKFLKLGPAIDLSSDIVDTDGSNDLVLIGKLLSSRKFNPASVKASTIKSWALHESEVRVSELSSNVFSFSFCKMRDRNHALENVPWSVVDQHLILKEWDSNLPWSMVDFSCSAFYVQVHGLPRNLVNKKAALTIGKQFKGLILVADLESSFFGSKAVIRMKVLVEVDKPLLPGFRLPRGDGEFLNIRFKYERLPDMCFYCGRIGHLSRWCSMDEASIAELKNMETDELPFGSWLKADSYSPLRSQASRNFIPKPAPSSLLNRGLASPNHMPSSSDSSWTVMVEKAPVSLKNPTATPVISPLILRRISFEDDDASPVANFKLVLESLSEIASPDLRKSLLGNPRGYIVTPIPPSVTRLLNPAMSNPNQKGTATDIFGNPSGLMGEFDGSVHIPGLGPFSKAQGTRILPNSILKSKAKFTRKGRNTQAHLSINAFLAPNGAPSPLSKEKKGKPLLGTRTRTKGVGPALALLLAMASPSMEHDPSTKAALEVVEVDHLEVGLKGPVPGASWMMI